MTKKKKNVGSTFTRLSLWLKPKSKKGTNSKRKNLKRKNAKRPLKKNMKRNKGTVVTLQFVQIEDEVNGQDSDRKGTTRVVSFPTKESAENVALYALTLHNHESFATFIGSTSDGCKFLFAHGEPLDTFISKLKTPPPLSFFSNCFRSISKGVAYMFKNDFHFETLVGSDIIIVSGEGKAKISAYHKILYTGKGKHLSPLGDEFVLKDELDTRKTRHLMCFQLGGLLSLFPDYDNVEFLYLKKYLNSSDCRIDHIMHQPLFWSPRKRLDFISCLSARIHSCLDEKLLFDQVVNEHEPQIFPKTGWFGEVDVDLHHFCYNGKNNKEPKQKLLGSFLIKDLRNCAEHIRETEMNLRHNTAYSIFQQHQPQEYQDIRSGVWAYFESKFRHLLVCAFDFSSLYHQMDPDLNVFWRGKWKGVDVTGVEIDEDPQISPPHVLVVDDESFYRVAHEAMFKKHSCKVSIASSGLEALEYLGLADVTPGSGIEAARGIESRSRTENPVRKVSLVCSDYHMTNGMSGLDLLMKMKESDTTKDVPFVFVASDVDVELPQINKCLEAGALVFIKKPLKDTDLEYLVKLLNNPAS